MDESALEDEYDASSEAELPVRKRPVATRVGPASTAVTADLTANQLETQKTEDSQHRPATKIVWQRIIYSKPGSPLLPPWLKAQARNRTKRKCEAECGNDADCSPTQSSVGTPTHCTQNAHGVDMICDGLDVESTEASEGEDSEDFSHC